MPQRCSSPSATSVNLADGNVVSPDVLVPQQATLPSLESAQVCPMLAESTSKVSEGGGHVPTPAPQQATVRSFRIPHVYWLPPATARKVPAGGVAAPAEYCPQHSIEPPTVIAQACS